MDGAKYMAILVKKKPVPVCKKLATDTCLFFVLLICVSKQMLYLKSWTYCANQMVKIQMNSIPVAGCMIAKCGNVEVGEYF